jgi:hypothetical protein
MPAAASALARAQEGRQRRLRFDQLEQTSNPLGPPQMADEPTLRDTLR